MPTITHGASSAYDIMGLVRIVTSASDNDTWRIARLHRVIGWLQCAGIPAGIAHIHDHEGELYVSWTCDWSQADMKRVGDAWVAQGEHMEVLHSYLPPDYECPVRVGGRVRP
jgi:hypothetical protein